MRLFKHHAEPRHRFSNGHHGGWNPQRADIRDRYFVPDPQAVNSTPLTYELPGIQARTDTIPRMNQGQEGSCVGHGTTGAFSYVMFVQGVPVVMLSRAMAYYNARIPEHTTDQDSGASVRDGVKGLAKYGVCTEAEFPYNDQVFNKAPSKVNYTEGQSDKALLYKAVHQPSLNTTIATGRPIVYGMTCYSSMMSDQVAETGIIPVPTRNDSPEGGHCTWLFGYNATSTPWTSPSGLVYPPNTKAGRNSWQNEDGTWWGADGNYFINQWMFDNGQCSDYWTLESSNDVPATGAVALAA